MSQPRQYTLSACAIVLVLLLCFSRLCLQPGSLLVDPEKPSVDHAVRGKPRALSNDLTSYFLPRLIWIQHAIGEGGWPSFWDSSGFGGRARLGNPQAGLFYPPLWPLLWWGSASSLGWLTVGHLAWGGFGLFLLARSLKLSPFASTVGGIYIATNPYILAQVFEGHYPHVWSACWYPWAFLSWKRAFEGSRAAGLTLSVLLALILTAGHPQEWYYLVIALGGFSLADGFHAPTGFRRSSVLRSVGLFLTAIALCLGLSAVEIVPDFLAQLWTTHSPSTDPRTILYYNVQLANLLQWFHPFALGSPDRYLGRGNYWETQLSIGLIPFALLCLGLVRIRNRPEMRRWFVLGILCLVFAAGPKLGLYELCYRILPGMDRFRVPSRTLFLANLCWAIMVAWGIDAIRDPATNPLNVERIRSALRRSILIAMSLGLVVLAISHHAASTSKQPVKPSIHLTGSLIHIVNEPVFWFSLVSLGLVVSIKPRFPRVFRNQGWILGTLAILELVAHSHEILKISPPERFDGDSAIVASLDSDARDSFRLAASESVLSDLTAARLGWEKTSVNDSFQVQNAALLYESLYEFLDPRHPPGWGTHPMDQEVIRHKGEIAQAVLDRMSVKWVVTEESPGLPGLTVVAEERPKFSVSVNRDPLPRAYVVPRAKILERRPDRSIGWVRDISAREFVMLEEADPLPVGPRQTYLAAGFRSVNPDHLIVEVETDAPGFLVIANTWDPGWSAIVDGQPSRVWRGNLAQQAVVLTEAGRHRVELRFRPEGFALGFGISAMSLVGWLGLIAFWLRSPSAPRADGSPPR